MQYDINIIININTITTIFIIFGGNVKALKNPGDTGVDVLTTLQPLSLKILGTGGIDSLQQSDTICVKECLSL